MNKKNLVIGVDGFKLPLEAVTQTFAVLAIRGAGKTNTCVVIAEEMLSAGAQVVVIDPTNSWWGLRSSSDGKSDGFSITVLGGDHGDLPLEATAGRVLAEFVVHTNASVIFSVRHMSKNARYQFVADFGERLFQLKDTHRTPMHLILDEADRFVPQRIQPDQTRMFGAVDDLVRLGRSSGVGVSLISQRAAVINKDVLSQTENLICLRTIGKHDRDALEDWAEAHAGVGEMKKFMDSLASLERGEAWVWSPFWLKVFERVRIRMRTTFDSSATPEFGKIAAAPKRVAEVDLHELQKQMAATIEKAKADDPRELRKKIAELERAAKSVAAAAPATTKTVTKNATKEQIAAAHKKGYDLAIRDAKRAWGPLQKVVERSIEALQKAIPAELEWNDAVIDEVFSSIVAPPVPQVERYVPQVARPLAQLQHRVPQVSSNGDGKLSGPEQRILDAIAWLNFAKITEPINEQVAFLAGYSPTSTGYTNPRSGLSGKGYVAYPRNNQVCLTQEGAALANAPVESPSVQSIQSRVLSLLTGPEARILEPCLRAYPHAITNDECAAAAGYSPTSTGYTNPRSGLSGKGLIEYPQNGTLRARAWLFLE